MDSVGAFLIGIGESVDGEAISATGGGQALSREAFV